ncbi:acyl-CoA dehydrogenase family protein [Roseomonas marmotae]|uniref:Acyl-CoA/acyl-ACP dehydrogenase n=1 Tax=Roseomonas marmotae TaxID=2768161 RepID=A0ABS3KIU9_9PROT|nr:acyl-CoA dehydrogenase family protein [Roseomonas marmotae]MBO1076548.1 acyl-CoA/acyl-ACP dehydrogenase [Roseomonas marmotae]QTI81837.1 acyl-CoA/acyl-ACP dehydrogenase [Roseomonas marmotae]
MSLALATSPLPPDPAALIEELAGRAAAYDREASFPHENIAALHRAGLLGLTVPRAYGGAGAGLAEAAEAIGLVAQGCASTGLIFAMQLTQQAALARNERVSPALRARVGMDAVRQGALMNALRVEPELGSPSRGGLPRTLVRRQADGSLRLSGRKIYSTGAPGLSWMLVWARDDAEAPNIGLVLVPAGAPGLRIEESWDHLGMRATGSHDVVFEDVPLPGDHALDLRPPAAWGAPDPAFGNWNAATLGALYTGIARAARDWTVTFLRHRVPTGLGAPLATLPRMQEKMGEIEALLAANKRLIASLARDFDAGRAAPMAEAHALKSLLVENAVRAVETAAGLAGNHAHSRRNPLERHLRDVLCGRVHVPTAEAAHVAAGRAALLP